MTAHNRKAGDKRLVDMTASDVAAAPTWTPDLPKVHTYEQEFPINAATSYVQRLDHDERGRIVEWAVIQVRRVDGKQLRVVVYDTCHGKGVHVHFYDSDGNQFAEESLWKVACHKDLEEGLDYAVLRVSEAWQENERRSERGY